MCGIAGEIRFDHQGPDQEAVWRMVSALEHRGPDEEGRFASGPVAMGMRRLSIVGISTGSQPLQTQDSNLSLVFNGEIYNYPELKNRFESTGRSFVSGSDGESILALYEEKGGDENSVLNELNGMYALALWDEKKQTLFLARDPMGIKPLFYQFTDHGLIFASELKAILAHPLARKELNPQAPADYLCFSYCPGEKSFYSHIKKLMPGHVLKINSPTIQPKQFYSLAAQFKNSPRSTPSPSSIKKALEKSIDLELLADVPIGAFLSGGIDSSAVVALMRPKVKDLVTFSLGFAGDVGDLDERARARETARHLKTDHIDIELEPEEIAQEFDQALAYFDEPFGGGLHTWFLSREAAKTHKVVMTGIGADELLGGYGRNLRLSKMAPWHLLPQGLKAIGSGVISALAAAKNPTSDAPRRLGRLLKADASDSVFAWISLFSEQELAALFKTKPQHFPPWKSLTKSYQQWSQEPSLSNTPDEVSWVELKATLVDDFLSYTDRTTMAHHLEARVPFLNKVFVEEVLSWPWQQRFTQSPKAMLYESVADLLSPGFSSRKKQPFLLPVARWLRGPLRPFLEETLLSDQFASGQILHQSQVRQLVQNFQKGEDRAWQVWHLMGLERFLRKG